MLSYILSYNWYIIIYCLTGIYLALDCSECSILKLVIEGLCMSENELEIPTDYIYLSGPPFLLHLRHKLGVTNARRCFNKDRLL